MWTGVAYMCLCAGMEERGDRRDSLRTCSLGNFIDDVMSSDL